MVVEEARVEVREMEEVILDDVVVVVVVEVVEEGVGGTVESEADWLESSEAASGVVGGVASGEMVSLAGSGGRGDNGWSVNNNTTM